MFRLAAVAACLLLSASFVVSEEMRFRIEGLPEDATVGVPLVSSVPHDAEPGAFMLTGDDGKALSAQIASSPAGRGVELCIVVPADDAEVAKQPLRPGQPGEGSEPLFRFEEDKEKGILKLFEGDKPALDYCFGMQLKEGVKEDRRRACYAHPLYGLDGEVLTDDFPRDHYHHRGFFWGWPHMQRGEKTFSIWDIRGVQQRFETWANREVGPVCAQFETTGGWFLGEEKVCEERVWFRVWRAGEVGRAIDVWLQWTALDEPIVIRGQSTGNKGYGGPNLRFAPRPKDSTVITTSEGALQKNKDSVYSSHAWADLSAPFHGADKVSGAAVFCNQANPRFPDAWLLRHYGVLCVCWPGREEVTFEPGKPVEMRYRVWVHRGDAEQGRVSEAYRAYAEPPVVKTAR